MTTLELAKKNYDRGLWTGEMLAKLVAKNKLTAAGYQTVTGEEYVAESTGNTASADNTGVYDELAAAYKEGVNEA